MMRQVVQYVHDRSVLQLAANLAEQALGLVGDGKPRIAGFDVAKALLGTAHREQNRAREEPVEQQEFGGITG